MQKKPFSTPKKPKITNIFVLQASQSKIWKNHVKIFSRYNMSLKKCDFSNPPVKIVKYSILGAKTPIFWALKPLEIKTMTLTVSFKNALRAFSTDAFFLVGKIRKPKNTLKKHTQMTVRRGLRTKFCFFLV